MNRRRQLGDFDDPPPRKKPKRSTTPKGTILDAGDSKTLEDLLAEFDITRWDFVLVGDGSGSNWAQQAAWASVSIERETMERLVWGGAVNRGTVNFAEIMAYLQPLTYFAGREADRRKNSANKTRAYNVHIITDSQYCRDTGRTRSAMVSKNAGLWACLNGLARQGMVLHWHWLKRDLCGLNAFCDELARRHRLLITENDQQTAMALDGYAVDDINPSPVAT